MSRINSDRLKLELRRARVPALQYLFLAACAIFALAIMLKNQYFDKPWVQKSTYNIQFDDVKGVVPGQQRVRMAGIDVGIITASKVGPNNKPILEVKIEDKYGDFFRNAKMSLRPLTPLQDIYLDIDDRGDQAAGKLEDGGTLTGGRATSPVDVSRVLNTFDQDTSERLRVLVTQFSEALDDGGGESFKRTFAEVAPFLQAAQRTTGAVADRRRNMKRLVHNLGDLTVALGERDRQLTALVRDGSATLTTIGSVQQPFDRTLAALPDLLSTMRSSFAALRAAEDELDPALRALKPVSDELESGLRGLERFTGDARPALTDLRRPVRELAPLARSLQPTAESLTSAMRQLAPQAPAFDRITAELPPCFQNLQGFFQNTMSVTKFYDDAVGPIPRSENFSDGASGPGIPDGETEAGTKAGSFVIKQGIPCTGEVPPGVSRSNVTLGDE